MTRKQEEAKYEEFYSSLNQEEKDRVNLYMKLCEGAYHIIVRNMKQNLVDGKLSEWPAIRASIEWTEE